MSRFNLLEEAWIPVKGCSKHIKVSEIVHSDILGLDAPRADFNAALMQFLIGLLQTVMPPENPREWRKLYAAPPTESELQVKLDGIKPAFYLDGDGYRFMQDGLAKEVGKHLPIEEMIFGAPGGSGKEGNKDHFTKRNDISGLCYSCSATGLLAANIFAEDGGQSYFPTMRGNGYISTLVCLDETNAESSLLWKNIWLNVLCKKNPKIEVSEFFMWCKDLPDKPQVEQFCKNKFAVKSLKQKKKESKDKELKKQISKELGDLEKNQKLLQEDLDSLVGEKEILPDENNFLQVYWAWMRRFLLDTETLDSNRCGICHATDNLITKFYKKNKGYKYPKEHWQNRHPFSPSEKYERANYDQNNEKYKDKMLALSMSVNGLPYSNWQDFLLLTTKTAPAEVIAQHLKKLSGENQLVISAFGYAMESNSPLGWYDSKTPLYIIEDESSRSQFENEANKFISAANRIADAEGGYLVNAIKIAWFGYDVEAESKKKPKDRKKDPFVKDPRKNKLYDQPINIAKSFLSNTESKFYSSLQELHSLADNDQLTDLNLIKLRNSWYMHIKISAEDIFNHWAFKSNIQTNPRRIALAHKQLMQNLNSQSLKNETLGLPKEHKHD